MDPARLRILLPQRFDVMSRAMDSNVLSHWLGLAEACDVILWGPGLPGYEPTPLDVVAREQDCDLILLPDFHHGIPGFWDELWRGAEASDVPVCFYLSDFGAAVEGRRAVIERFRPKLLLVSCDPSLCAPYEDLREAVGARYVEVPLGFDPALFSLPPPSSARDIDLLLCGSHVPEVYPVRALVKEAGALLRERFRVLDVHHPGYYETDDVAPWMRGQPLLARLMRRSRLVLAGSAWRTVTRKFLEAAATGAVAVGDVPLDAGRCGMSAETMLVIEPGTPVEDAAAAIAGLLDDEPRRHAIAERALAAITGCDHRSRGVETAAALATALDPPPRQRRPRTLPRPPATVCVLASPDPEGVPQGRSDWLDVWAVGEPGASRTRRLERLLHDSQADICIIALDPDVALPADALLLASMLDRQGTGIVARCRRGGAGEPVVDGMVHIACRRGALLEALAVEHGRFGPETALLRLAQAGGWTVARGECLDDPVVELARLVAASAVGWTLPPGFALQTVRPAAEQALRAGRATVALELLGWLRFSTGLSLRDGQAKPPLDVAPEDPELLEPPPPGAGFLGLDVDDDAALAGLVHHARLGPTAPPLAIGVPMRSGRTPEEAAAIALAALAAAGVDDHATPDLIVLERPLWEGELTWLRTHAAAPWPAAA